MREGRSSSAEGQHAGKAAVVASRIPGGRSAATRSMNSCSEVRVDTGRRHEVDAVGIDFDRGRVVLAEVGDDLLDDALPGESDALGGVVVVEQPAAIAEIAVE